MAIVSKNLYNATTGAKLNEVPITAPMGPSAVNHILTGLQSGVPITVKATNVDGAGNESPLSAPFTFTPPSVVAPGGPLPDADVTAISEIMASRRAVQRQPGIWFGTSGPAGSSFIMNGQAAQGGRAATIDDHFRVASVTKVFTGQAVLIALDRGDIKLTDHLNQFSEKLVGVPNSDKITIRMLLQMRAGTHSYDTQPAFQQACVLSPTGAYSSETALAAIKAGAPAFEPDTGFGYTNGAYIILGYILEHIYQKSIRDIVIDDVITPLGLTETTWPLGVYPPAPYANGYGMNQIKIVVNSVPIFGPLLGMFLPDTVDQTAFNGDGYAGAAGAITSTIGDLRKLAAALRDGTLLSSRTKIMQRTTFDTVVPVAGYNFDKYAFGCALINIGQWFGFPGSLPGYSAAVMFHPPTGACIVATENFQTPVIDCLTQTFPRAAERLYPGSLGEPSTLSLPPGVYSDRTAKSTHYGATSIISLTPGTVESTRSGPSNVYGATEVTGGQVFEPLTEKNVARTNQPVPEGLLEGAYVRIVGCGQHGLPGGPLNTPGGSGGSGGPACDEFLIPKEDLVGLSYSTQQGIHNASWGTDTFFELSNGKGVRIHNGVLTVTGLTGVTTRAGSNPGANNTFDAGPGGGNGGFSSWGYVMPGTPGGNSTTQDGGVWNASVADPNGKDGEDLHAGSGAAGGLSNATGYPVSGFAGGNGGTPGGGGGGGGSGWDGSGPGGNGGDGLVNVRLV